MNILGYCVVCEDIIFATERSIAVRHFYERRDVEPKVNHICDGCYKQYIGFDFVNKIPANILSEECEICNEKLYVQDFIYFTDKNCGIKICQDNCNVFDIMKNIAGKELKEKQDLENYEFQRG
jgi:hypothetical protein